uniref:Uncharacterized protein n=1 Tax=Leersia perrieri TaxID=77586 RepID=A0A0D9UYL7_9ORYZ
MATRRWSAPEAEHLAVDRRDADAANFRRHHPMRQHTQHRHPPLHHQQRVHLHHRRRRRRLLLLLHHGHGVRRGCEGGDGEAGGHGLGAAAVDEAGGDVDGPELAAGAGDAELAVEVRERRAVGVAHRRRLLERERHRPVRPRRERRQPHRRHRDVRRAWPEQHEQRRPRPSRRQQQERRRHHARRHRRRPPPRRRRQRRRQRSPLMVLLEIVVVLRLRYGRRWWDLPYRLPLRRRVTRWRGSSPGRGVAGGGRRRRRRAGSRRRLHVCVVIKWELGVGIKGFGRLCVRVAIDFCWVERWICRFRGGMMASSGWVACAVEMESGGGERGEVADGFRRLLAAASAAAVGCCRGEDRRILAVGFAGYADGCTVCVRIYLVQFQTCCFSFTYVF